ncbi:Cytochrome c oxidase assembly factor 3, mitochondrial [Lachnellula subtilissima]|uniref:Cytochrome c oxidase assembly factor 3 n=1 Tax=Lachnellula subtilissima TaxID=602034 RepID=A0A8H8UIX2_9HELO|nr:Cytochrome c oxidase assembly factor 3, mitochondrial [Lachnellula subtilissima]
MGLIPRSSYYDAHYKQSAALIRARRPYLIKNTLTGLGLFAFTISIYAYTIKAVSQDEFEDVQVPTTQQSPRAGASTSTSAPAAK